jgi:transcriptional repressor NrdR
METLVDEIEAELQQRTVREVTSQEIGELVLQNLRNLSEVAYIRFASVYRKFQGIRDFIDTLNQLQGQSVIADSTPAADPAEATLPRAAIAPVPSV